MPPISFRFLLRTAALLSVLMLTAVSNAQTYPFTNCGATGKNGPTQLAINSNYVTGNPLAGSVTVINNGIQQWTVPVTGLYRLTVAGASGGASALSPGGSGIAVQSELALTAGQVLNIVVGQAGQKNAGNAQFYTGGSGGGGSFVYSGAIGGSSLLMAAGGGGGGLSSSANVVASNISNANFNTNGYSISDAGNNISAGGTNGNGGGFSARLLLSGGPGTGWVSDFNNTFSHGYPGLGGARFTGGSANAAGKDGGFGGGGASGDNSGGTFAFGWSGGGGGYSGGGSGHNGANSDGQMGGGGGSFLTGNNQLNLGINKGNGYVTINFMSKPAGALNFDGINDFIKIADKENLHKYTSGFSIEFWARPTVIDGQKHWVVSKDNGNTDLGYLVGIDASNKWRFAVGNYAIDITGGSEVVPGNYYHIACTFDGSIANLFVNGGKAASALTSGITSASNSDIIIGGRDASGVTEMFAGDVDELRIWNRAVCPGELFNNRNCELTSGQTALAIYYKMNQGFATATNTSVNTAMDQSGNSNNGNLNGFALAGGSSNWVEGHIAGSCIAFIPPVATVTADGSTTFCAGGSVTLTASNGNTYLWSNGQTANAITVTVPGSYSVTVINNDDCPATTSPIPVIVNALPSVSISTNGPLTFCPGGSVILTASSGGSYVWNTAAITQSVTINVSGIYSVRVTDTNGCSASASVTVAVEDRIPPTITAPGDIRVVLANNNCSAAVVELGTPVVSDNCGIASVSNNAPSDFPLGNTTVTWTVTDNSSNVTTATQVVTVVAPEILVAGNTVEIIAGDTSHVLANNTEMGSTLPGIALSRTFTIRNTGSADLTVYSINFTGRDQETFSVSGITLPFTVPASTSTDFSVSFRASDLGERNAVMLINNNDCDESAYAIPLKATVVCIKPSFSISPSDINAAAATGTCNAPVSYRAEMSGSPVPDITYIFSGATNGNGTGTGSGSIFNKGVTTVVIAAANACGATACSFTVTVSDQEMPVITAPADMVVRTDAGSSMAANLVLGAPVVSDNCHVFKVYNNAPSIFPIGITLITWAVSDDAGNTATANQKVTVADKDIPVISALPVAVVQSNDTGKCGAKVNWTTPVATDNAPGVTLISDHKPGDFFPMGITPVTYTATDASGNTVSASFTIRISDTEKPLLSGIPADLAIACNEVLTPAIVTATDNCDAAPGITFQEQRTQDADISSVLHYNYSIVRTWTATDASGNSSTATQQIKVQDRTAPVITVPALIHVKNDQDICGAVVNFAASAIDECNSPVTLSYSQQPGTVFSVGNTTVTVTATDVSGNISAADFIINVVDEQPPVIIVPSDLVVKTDAGACAATRVSLGNASTADNCGVSIVSNDAPVFFAPGITKVTWSVKDIHGNMASAVQTVTVIDSENPTVRAPRAYSMPNDAGLCGRTITDIGTPVTTDNCAVALVSNDHPGSFYPVGTTIVTWTVTDIHGNITDTAMQVITVIDNEFPNISIADISVNTDEGICGAKIRQVLPLTSDNCAVASVTSDHPGNMFPVGTSQVTWTVTDIHGLSRSVIQTVTVTDTVKPVVITRDITVGLDASGNAQITASQVDNGSSDNCQLAAISLDRTRFSCADLGANTVTLTAKDKNGNTSFHSATVLVIDDVKPVVRTKNITVYLGATGDAYVNADQVNDGSYDNCSIASMTIDKRDFTCADRGSNTVILTVTDGSGNTAAKTATVIVADTTRPIVAVKNITVYLDATGHVTISPQQVDNGSTDNCMVSSMVLDKSSFNCESAGVNEVVLTVTDPGGNKNSKTAFVTIMDNNAPVAVARNIIVNLDDKGQAIITPSQINNGSADNCSIVSFLLSKTLFNCSDIGENKVSLIIADAAGNTSVASATVTISDISKPVVNTKNITLYLDAAGHVSLTPSQLDNGSFDNCSIAMMTADKTSFGCADIGSNTVILTVTDASGNSASKSATVTVVDNSKPVVNTKDITIYLDASGQATITGSQIDDASTDNCSIATRTLDRTHFTCSDAGVNLVNLTITDRSGNQDSKTAKVTIIDSSRPVLTTKDITIYLDASGHAVITAQQVINISTDNCGITSITSDRNSFACADLGANTIMIRITDTHGNTETKTASVTVIDNVKPTVITKNIIVYLDPTGHATITASQVDNGSTDNCGIITRSLDRSNFDRSQSGNNTVTLTVADASGNQSSKTAIVTVIDNTAPTVRTKDIAVYLDASGKVAIDAAGIDNGSYGSSAIAGRSVDRSFFNCSDLGANTVTLSVTDMNGNTASAKAIVLVKDTTAPVVITQNITILLDATGVATITASQVDNGTADNCSIMNRMLDKTVFNCSNLGLNTVILSVTDASGNKSSRTAVVKVLDKMAPVISGIGNLTFCANTGRSYTLPAVTASDNCGIVSVTYDINGATTRSGAGFKADGLFNNGTSTITWTVTDASGNATTSIATITVNLLPALTLTVSNTDAFCNRIMLTASPAGNGAVYNWQVNNNPFAATQQVSLSQNSTDGVYSVTATINGCTSAQSLYTFQKQGLVNSYTILASDEVDLGENNTVASGSVGVMSVSGGASFHKNSSVSSPGSFVRAKNICRNGPNINISNPVYSAATGIVLPAMLYNTGNTSGYANATVNSNTSSTLPGNFKNLTLKKGSNTIVTGNNFGTIKIEQGAQVTFTSAIINIDKLKVDKGPRNGYTYLHFAQDTKVLVSGSVAIASQVNVNPENNKVTFYLGNKNSDDAAFTVKGGDTKLAANIYMPKGNLKVTGGYGYGDSENEDDEEKYFGQGNSFVYMTGFFIAKQVQSEGRNIVWNSFDCSTPPVNAVTSTPVTLATIKSTEKEAGDGDLVVKVMPNPSTTYFTLKFESRNTTLITMRVLDGAGRVVDARSGIAPNSTLQVGAAFGSGTYYAEVVQGTQRKLTQLIKMR